MSFDVWEASLPRIEIYGSEGMLSVPDPNVFEGPVRLWRYNAREWREMPLINEFTGNWRGLGVADLARALRDWRPHRANGDLAFHVLDIMHAVHDASREGRHIELSSSCERPAPMQAGEFQGWTIAPPLKMSSRDSKFARPRCPDLPGRSAT